MFQILKCKTLGEYSDHYLRIDVLLLADIFESFRETCFDIYSIDPAHCYSAPSLSYNAMLKTIDKPIPLISDYSMHLMVESGIRGGFCNVTKRYVRANNRYMGDGFNKENASEEGETYLTYFDANNLYGYCLAENLPYGDFEWVDCQEFQSLRETLNCQMPADDSAQAFIIECELNIPKHLHDYFADFPPAPENVSISQKKCVPPPNLSLLFIIRGHM